MNELLQKHGCSNVFTLPEGLKELMSDISREVLREQPPVLYEFIANYLSALLITREHGILAVRILDDLCDCRPTVTEHLHWLGIGAEDVKVMAEIIKRGIEGKGLYEEPVVEGEGEVEVSVDSEETEAEEGYETVREMEIMKLILEKVDLDEAACAKVCQVIRNAYRDYWYRKKLLEKELKLEPETPWEIAAEHTLDLYKRTKPSLTELNRASERIQAAYKGYHVRKNILAHLKKPKDIGPKREMPGPPLDIADSREIDLGDVIKLKVKEDNVSEMFKKKGVKDLGLRYDPMKAIAHDDTPKKPSVKIASKTDSTLTILERSGSALETAQKVVKKLLFSPKTSADKFQMSKDLFLSPLPSKTEPSEPHIVVVVPPKKYDSVCMCEEDLDDDELTAIQTNALATTGENQSERQRSAVTTKTEKTEMETHRVLATTDESHRSGVTTRTEKIEMESQRCLRQSTTEKSKRISISSSAKSGIQLELKGSITPKPSPIDFPVEEASKSPDAKQLAPDSQDNMFKMIPFSEAPSETIVVNETTVPVGEGDKDKVLDKPVVVQAVETTFRLSPIPRSMPAIPEVDEKQSTTSSNLTDTLDSTSAYSGDPDTE